MPDTIAAHEVSSNYCPPPRLGDGHSSSYTPLTDDLGGERVVDLGPETYRAPDWDAARIADPAQQVSHAGPGNQAAVAPHVGSNLYLRICRITDTATAALFIAAIAMSDALVPFSPSHLLSRQVELKSVALLIIFALLWSPTIRFFGTYDPRVNSIPMREARTVIIAVTAAMLIAVGVMLLIPADLMSPTKVLEAWPALVVATLGVRWAVKLCVTARRPKESRRVLILGSGPRALRTYYQVSGSSRVRYEVVGFADTTDHLLPVEIRERMLGSLPELGDLLMRVPVDEVLIALPIKSCYGEIQRAIEVCDRMGIESRYLSDVFRGGRVEADLDSATRAFAQATPEDSRVAAKRAIDIVGAGIGLIVLAPLFLIIAILIRLNTPGSTFFVQERYGLRKRRFKMYKFRTMVADAERMQASLEHRNEAIGPIFKIWRDPRITRIGQWLRVTSLDELPQLWNVLLGDMSLVGPRPMSLRDVHRFTEPWVIRRFSVRPGITGLWQVSGRSNLPFDSWVALDLKYIDNWSLNLDLQILARTIPAVLRGSGAA